MQFTGGGFPMIIPDGTGGQFDEGTFGLTILEATAGFARKSTKVRSSHSCFFVTFVDRPSLPSKTIASPPPRRE